MPTGRLWLGVSRRRTYIDALQFLRCSQGFADFLSTFIRRIRLTVLQVLPRLAATASLIVRRRGRACDVPCVPSPLWVWRSCMWTSVSLVDGDTHFCQRVVPTTRTATRIDSSGSKSGGDSTMTMVLRSGLLAKKSRIESSSAASHIRGLHAYWSFVG